MAKENEKRERTKESKEKESNSLALSARTREELQQIARSIPTVEQVISFAHTIIGFTDDNFIREWHRQMSMAFWCDEFGNPIRNWGYVFNKWRLNRRLFEKLRDPERIPSQGSTPSARPPAHPQERFQQGEIDMRTHSKNRDTEKIIYKRAERQYFRHRNELLRLFDVTLSCQ